ncbi:MAG: hypothetical protein JXB45_10455 [Candidatus Krumholzibacteriota bacterium]|nr:hypothetical protein [Candidatus Krumholzibacteriota bacterium]
MLRDNENSRFPALSLLLLLAGFFLIPPPARAATDINQELSLGYDSFIDRFTILEDDTTEAIQELYLHLANRFYLQRNDRKFRLENKFRYGNQTVDEELFGECGLGSPHRTQLEIRGNVHWKHFRTGSDYEFGNDYLQTNTYLKLKKTLPSGLRVVSRSRFESLHYRERTQFDYDYYYLESGLDLEKGSFLERFIKLGATLGFREAPDTTALSYRRIITGLETNLFLRDNFMLEISVTGDRRDYRENVRSSFWNIFSSAALRVHKLSGSIYTCHLESEMSRYDDPSSIYFNTHFFRGGFKISFPVHSSVSLFVDPKFARMYCGAYREEEYWEGTIGLGLDIMNGDRFWLTGSYEPGYRNYLWDENTIYSDFYLNRISLMGSVTAPGKNMINLFITHDPERHMRRDDDFSITMISVSLSRQF